MRSFKLPVAIATAATLLTLAPALASARGRHGGRPARPAIGCRVSLDVVPHLITADETVLAYGHLSCAIRSEDASQTVTLYQDSVGSPGYTVAGTTTTEASGFYQITTAALTANSHFYVVADSAQSPTRSVRVAAQVTLDGPTEGTQLLSALSALSTGRRNRVTFTGTVIPEDPGALVVLQRQDALGGNEWHRIQFGRVGPGGTFSMVHSFVVPGDANVRVLILSSHRNIASPSNVLTYEISQAQNPQLTINSSDDPIPYLQPLTLSGTLAGTPNTIVTLLAHTGRRGAFAPIAQVKTDGSGDYTFPPQLPVDSTFYAVQGDGRSSAVLYEDIADVLTATVSPGTSIQAGQTLTFSGAVSPDHAGHVIYLERQNADGVGFHVVEVSALTPASTYSIAHTVYDAGTSVFRVRIPGDPQNGGAVSPLFTIQVSAAPSASTITPEAPGNSTLPNDGQV